MTLNETQWNSMKFNETQWDSMKFNGIQWNSMKINEIQWKSMCIQWKSMNTQGKSMNVNKQKNENQWKFNEHQWFSMRINTTSLQNWWKSMNINTKSMKLIEIPCESMQNLCKTIEHQWNMLKSLNSNGNISTSSVSRACKYANCSSYIPGPPKFQAKSSLSVNSGSLSRFKT